MSLESDPHGRFSSEDVKSAAEFLEDIKQKVRQQPGAENDLLKILEDHILKENPGKKAVEEAFKEIVCEAEARAQGKDDDESNHD